MPDVAHPPCPDPFNLAAYVLAEGEKTPRKTAMEILGDAPEVWSYARLTAAVRGVARGLLDAGLKPDDIVLLRLGNTADFPIAYLGIIAAGMIAVPTSSALSQSEIDTMAKALNAAAIVQDPDILAPVAPRAQRISLHTLRCMYDLPPAPFHMGDPERAAYIVFTSGTSGRARGVIHAHRAIWARRMMQRDWYDLRPSDRLLHAGAFNWTFTLGTGLMDPWTLGATALIPAQGTPPAALGPLLAKHGATLFAAAPGIFRKVLQADLPKLPALRHGLSAGEKMPESLHRLWQRATGLHVYEAFGMSECSTFISSSPHRSAPPNALGHAQTGRKIALVDDKGAQVRGGEIGTIAVHQSDAGLMLGYHDAPQDTRARFQGDWFLTGDLARRDATGALFYEGRSDDMMNAGGFRVSPIEIEAVFSALPDVGQCAAVEITVKENVTVIALCYTAQQDVAQTTLEALATRQLARYKQPRIYHQSDASLPSSANGKLLRRVIRSQLEALYGQT